MSAGALLAAAAVLLGLACGGNGDGEQNIEISFSSPTPTPVTTPTATPTPLTSPSPTPLRNVCGSNPNPALVSELQVQEPQPDERVKSPLHVRGWGSEIALDNSGVVVAVIDVNGDPLTLNGDDTSKGVPPESRAGRIAAPGISVTEFTAPFATDILIEGLRAPTPYCIWVFLATTPEGFPRKVVQVPVIVIP